MAPGTWLRCVVALLSGLVAIGTARAEERRVETCIARVRPGPPAAPAAMFRHPERFDCMTPQARWGAGDYWALSRPLPPTPSGEALIVKSYALWQDRAELWALYADGHVATLHPITDASLNTAVEHALPARPAPAVRLLWRTRGSVNNRGVVLGVRVETAAAHARGDVGGAAAIGLVIGLCAALLFFNLALWVALRRTFQLAYCAMAGGLMLYVAAGAGLFHRALPAIGVLGDLSIGAMTFTLCVAGGLWFARSFLEREVLGRRAARAVDAVTMALIAVGVVKEAVAPWCMVALDRFHAAVFAAALAAIGIMAWRVAARRSATGWIWAATAATPALLAAMRAANSVPFLVGRFALGPSLLWVMTAGLAASSLAIVHRIHLVARERDQARAEEIAARLLADTDPLTGLLNRRAFLSRAIGREGEQHLLILDLDHFKRINETIGHDGGDEVLRAVARVLTAAAPAGALVARIGGEEFAIVVPAGAIPRAGALLDRLRAVALPFDLAITASIGSGTGPLTREADWKRLYRRADEALFAAKAAGRDRVREARPAALAA